MRAARDCGSHAQATGAEAFRIALIAANRYNARVPRIACNGDPSAVFHTSAR